MTVNQPRTKIKETGYEVDCRPHKKNSDKEKTVCYLPDLFIFFNVNTCEETYPWKSNVLQGSIVRNKNNFQIRDRSCFTRYRGMQTWGNKAIPKK